MTIICAVICGTVLGWIASRILESASDIEMPEPIISVSLIAPDITPKIVLASTPHETLVIWEDLAHNDIHAIAALPTGRMAEARAIGEAMASAYLLKFYVHNGTNLV